MHKSRFAMGWLAVLGLGSCVAIALLGPRAEQPPPLVNTLEASSGAALPVAMQLHPGPAAVLPAADSFQPVALAQGPLVLPMGVSLVPMTRAIAQAQGIPYSSGGYVASVAPESPAWRAGLAPGDIINRINGQ